MITNARMIIKRGRALPTIPVSNDNNDGTWVDTDIYEGELYLDVTHGKLYTRIGNDIYEITTTLVVHS
jgi:hypothetical protein